MDIRCLDEVINEGRRKHFISEPIHYEEINLQHSIISYKSADVHRLATVVSESLIDVRGGLHVIIVSAL